MSRELLEHLISGQDLNQDQAADLRTRLATFAEDWDRPEMDVYDDYDAAKSATR